MRTIEIPADMAFDILELIDDRADMLRDHAGESDRRGESDLSATCGALAAEWESDARTIRRALGIEIDGED